MLIYKMLMLGIEVLLIVFSVYLFFGYFNIFFERKKGKFSLSLGVVTLMVWQIGISDCINFSLSAIYNIGVTIGVSLFVVMIVFYGKIWKKFFFCIAFDAIWMLSELLMHNLLLIYCDYLARSRLFGSFTSKVLLMIVIITLKHVFTSKKFMDLSDKYSFSLVLIPIGSIYIMSVVFMLAYNAKGDYAERYSVIAVLVLLFLNVLIFYIYIKLADILYVRKKNLVYEQQLELCERHKEETEVSMLRVREVRHNMKNHLITILGYAEKGEYGKLKNFINDVMQEGNLNMSIVVNSGHIVTDSLIEYWIRIAENKGIEFKTELSIPMEMPFKGADISLILGNLLENAIEAAAKSKGRKYIRLKMKYDRDNLLIVVENSYKGKLKKVNGHELLTTKEDSVNHGIGLVSVNQAIRKYKGMMFIDDSIPEHFLIRIVLYGDMKKLEYISENIT